MADAMQELLNVMRRLRDPEGGCPWDREQTMASLVPHTLEEAYEVADAVRARDDGHLCEELGDLLFQVVFYARIAEEEQRFAFADVARAIADKLIRRHPHVFADAQVDSSAAQTEAWEKLKQQEREHKAQQSQQAHSELDGIGRALPALSRAQKMQRRAARVGFDWPTAAGVLEKMQEEIRELSGAITQGDARHVQEEMGDLLFTCVNLARHLEVDAEQALREANHKFEQRFRRVEDLARAARQGLPEMGLEQMEQLWQQAKRETCAVTDTGS